MTEKKKKKKLYLPSSFLIILGITFTFIILSMILYGAGVKTTNADGETVSIVGLGILDIFTSIWYGFKDKAEVILFILCIGGLLNIMARTKAIDLGIERLIKKLKGKEIMIIPVLMIVFGLGGTTYGMWEETIAFFPILIPIFIKAGYGPFTAVLTILVGAGTGTLASTINPFSVGAVPILKDGSGFQPGQIIGVAWVAWVIYMAIAISFVMFVAIKTKRKAYNMTGLDEAKIEKAFSKIQVSDEKFTTRRKVTLTIFILTFVLMILAYLPWTSWITIDNVATNKSMFWLASTSMWDGGWGGFYFIAISGVFLLASIIILFINKSDFVEKGTNKENVFINTFIAGSKDVLSVCLLIATAGGLAVVLQNSNIGLLIANSASGLGSAGLIGFAIVIFILSLFLSFLIPSSSGFAAAFMPIFFGIATKAFKGNDVLSAMGLSVLAFIFASGIVNLVSPTSAALMAYTEYAKIPYVFWLKKVLPYVLVLTIVAILLLSVFGGIAMSTGGLF